MRLGRNGSNDGMCVPVSNARRPRRCRTTFQHFDEPHRLILPNAKHAVETMLQNMPKRRLETPWSLYTSTAGQPGQNSVEEDVRAEAEAIAEGKAPTVLCSSSAGGPVPSMTICRRWEARRGHR